MTIPWNTPQNMVITPRNGRLWVPISQVVYAHLRSLCPPLHHLFFQQNRGHQPARMPSHHLGRSNTFWTVNNPRLEAYKNHPSCERKVIWFPQLQFVGVYMLISCSGCIYIIIHSLFLKKKVVSSRKSNGYIFCVVRKFQKYPIWKICPSKWVHLL